MRLIESCLRNGSSSVNFWRKNAMASFTGIWCCIQRSLSTVAMWVLLVGIQRDLNAPRIAIWKMISVDKPCALLNSRRLPMHGASRTVASTPAKRLIWAICNHGIEGLSRPNDQQHAFPVSFFWPHLHGVSYEWLKCYMHTLYCAKVAMARTASIRTSDSPNRLVMCSRVSTWTSRDRSSSGYVLSPCIAVLYDNPPVRDISIMHLKAKSNSAIDVLCHIS